MGRRVDHRESAASGLRMGESLARLRKSRRGESAGKPSCLTSPHQADCCLDSPAKVNIARQRMFYGHPARQPNGKLFHGLPPTRELLSR